MGFLTFDWSKSTLNGELTIAIKVNDVHDCKPALSLCYFENSAL